MMLAFPFRPKNITINVTMNYKNKRIEELKYQAENKDLIASQKKLNS